MKSRVKIVGNSYYGFYKDEYVDGVIAAEAISKQASEAAEDNVDFGADNASDSNFATSSGLSRTSNWLDMVEWGIRKDNLALIKSTGRTKKERKSPARLSCITHYQACKLRDDDCKCENQGRR